MAGRGPDRDRGAGAGRRLGRLGGGGRLEGPSFYAYLPADTYDKIYASGPDVIHTGVINATGKAVRDKGGYRFSGRWSFASGSNNADYICIHGVIEGEQATRLGVVPAASVQIEDVWHVSGLKGTSSNDIVVSDLFIPEEWTGNFAELPKIARYRLDQRQLGARFGSEFAAVAIGIAQAALDDITDIARNKIPATSRSKLAADPVAQYVTGQLATDLYMARTLLHQVGRDDQASAASGPPDDRATALRRARLSRGRRWPPRSSRAPTACPYHRAVRVVPAAAAAAGRPRGHPALHAVRPERVRAGRDRDPQRGWRADRVWRGC